MSKVNDWGADGWDTNPVVTVSGATSGNLLVACLHVRETGSGITYTDDPAWTKAESRESGSNNGYQYLYREATGNSSDNLSITLSNSRRWAVAIVELDMGGSWSFDASNSQYSSSSTTYSTGSATASDTDGTAVVMMGANDQDRWESGDTSLANGTVDARYSSSSTNNRPVAQIGHFDFTTSGAKSDTWTTSDSAQEGSAGILVFLGGGGVSNDVACTASLSFGSSASVSATGTLNGTATLQFGSSADLSALGELTTTASITFGSSASLTEANSNDVSATASIVFGSGADLSAIGVLQGTGNLQFGTNADLNAIGVLNATGLINFGSSASLTAAAPSEDITATANLVFGSGADLNATGKLQATGTLTFSSQAALSQFVEQFMTFHGTANNGTGDLEAGFHGTINNGSDSGSGGFHKG